MAFAQLGGARLPLFPLSRVTNGAYAGFLIVRTTRLLAARGDFVVGLRRQCLH